MAAPTQVPRVTPTGQPMRNGYQSLIAFQANADVLFWEKGVKPPGMDAGEGIPATTMHNTKYRTFGVPALITLTAVTTRVAYDVDLYTDILSLIRVENSITVHFPTGKALSFFGFLSMFDPAEMVENTQPEATVTIWPTNWDSANDLEEDPVVGTSA